MAKKKTTEAIVTRARPLDGPKPRARGMRQAQGMRQAPTLRQAQRSRRLPPPPQALAGDTSAIDADRGKRAATV